MSGHAGPSAVGGLIVRNGKHRGMRVPLKLPVTVIGRGDQCDVKLHAEGIAPLHCVVAITPAGPTVRAWDADNTLVNGKPTAAAVLHHGDELKVGPCSFFVSWFGELAPAEPDEPAIERGSGAEWSLKEREQALHEQEVQLSALLEEKQEQINGLLDQLATGREQFHREKAAIKDELAAIALAKRDALQLKRNAELARQKHHATYRKLIARAKRHRVEAAKELTAREQSLANRLARFEKEKAAFDAERASFHADAEKTRSRLQDAWHLLEEGQRRLLADRKEAEAIFADYQNTLDTRYGASTNANGGPPMPNRMETRCEALLAEIAGLEQRAANASLAVHELEQKRILLEADGVTVAPSKAIAVANPTPLAPVPLDARRDRSFDELMAELHLRERELGQEQKSVIAAKGELVRLSNELTDQRSVLAEQYAKLAAAARLWQQAEVATAGELEQLAGRVEQREQAVAQREQRLLASEDANRQRERELWQFRVTLEGWQAGLTAHESQWYAERDRTAAAIDRQRDHLARWEASLESLGRTWNELRMKERDVLSATIESWAGERREYLAARTRLDADAVQLARQAKACAVLMASLESMANSVDERKLRVTRKRWESHFQRFERLWESRQAAAIKAARGLDERFAELKIRLASIADERRELERDKQTWDATKLAKERTEREKENVLSLTVARAKRSDRELVELRSEVERIASTLLAAGQATGEETTVALMPARAA